jgi:hypothetical protein
MSGGKDRGVAGRERIEWWGIGGLGLRLYLGCWAGPYQKRTGGVSNPVSVIKSIVFILLLADTHRIRIEAASDANPYRIRYPIRVR